MNYQITPTEVNIVFYVLFILWSAFSLYYILKVARTRRPKSVIIEIYDSIPNVFTSLGVLGTFVGIFVGLTHFDTRQIDTSIPLLLDGLKTAFLTSIIGLILSLVFGRISRIFMERAQRAHNPLNDTSELSPESLLLESLVKKIDSSNDLLEKLADQVSQKSEVTSSTLLVVKDGKDGKGQTNSNTNAKGGSTNTTKSKDTNSFTQTVDNANLVVEKLSTNFANAVNQVDDPHQTDKLKQAVVQGIDPDLAVDQISQVVVIDNAKEKLQAYQAMEKRLSEVCEIQTKFFENVEQQLSQVLANFKQELEGVKQQVVNNLKEYSTQTIENVSQHVSKAVKKAVVESQETLAESAKDVYDKVKLDADSLAKSMNRGTNTIVSNLKDETASLMKFLVSQTNDYTSATKETVTNLEQRSQELVNTLNQISVQIKSTLAQTNNQTLEAFEDLQQSNQQESQKVLTKFVEITSGHLQQFLEVTHEFSTFFRQVSQQFNSQSNQNNAHIEQLSRQYAILSDSIEKIRTDISKLNQHRR